MHLMPLKCALTIVKMAIFYVVYILPQLFFKVLLCRRKGGRGKTKTVFLN